MTDHLSEDRLIAHYYGDDDDRAAINVHLESCARCRESLAQLSALLGVVKSSEMPEPLHGFEQRVWQKLQPHISESRKPRRFQFAVRQWVYALGITAALVLAFAAGRFTPRTDSTVPSQGPSAHGRERILLITVADHLDRSQLMLLELLNADTSEAGFVDRSRAAELVADNRLYRQAAQRDGDAATAAVLEELERVLQEVENSPDDWSADDLAVLRDAIENKGLILKVRVLGSQARDKAIRPKADTVVTTI